jgi:hypothetical protein
VRDFWYASHIRNVEIAVRQGPGNGSEKPRGASRAFIGAVARAFGFQRAMDHAGAAFGTLLAAAMLVVLGGSRAVAPAAAMRTVFLWAAHCVRVGWSMR